MTGKQLRAGENSEGGLLSKWNNLARFPQQEHAQCELEILTYTPYTRMLLFTSFQFWKTMFWFRTVSSPLSLLWKNKKSLRWAGIPQSVQRLAMGWTTKGSEFESRWGKNFLFSMSPRPALGPTQPPIQWVPVAISPGVKRPGRETDYCRDQENVGLYIYSPVRLHGVVLNYLSTGTILPYLKKSPCCASVYPPQKISHFLRGTCRIRGKYPNSYSQNFLLKKIKQPSERDLG
jgi:hypothetical protein